VTGLTFVAPPPGLEPLVRFDLEQVAGADGLFTLRPVDIPDRRLFLLDAGIYLPDYHPEISDEQAARLGVTGPEGMATFVVANHQDGVTTVNLLAPIVVNTATDMCAQFILEGQDLPVRSVLTV
jgi:flagellar assembly factor FliW